VKPAAFNYKKPSTLTGVLELLRESGEDSSILAGGQSLMPTLNMRLSMPNMLIDINGVNELAGISVTDKTVRIGSMTRHVELERSSEIADHIPLIQAAMPYIAHPAIRNRGTIGGSIALADPAAELPACLCALNGSVEMTSTSSTRKVVAKDFFKNLYETDLKADEIITAIDIPRYDENYFSFLDELSRRHGDYAMCGLAFHAKIERETISDAQIVFFAVEAKPIIATTAMKELEGAKISDVSVEAIQVAIENDLNPFGDLHASATLKLHYAKELIKRAITSGISNE